MHQAAKRLPPKNSKASDLVRQSMNEWGENGIPFFFILDYDLQKPLAWPLDKLSPDWIRFDFKGVSNADPTPASLSPQDVYLSFQGIDFQKYNKAFDLVQQHLKNGDTFLLNLTFPTPVETNLSLEQIFYTAKAPYRLWLKDQFVVFSPESFVVIKDGEISSFPMKGTISAALPNAAQRLLNDPKERAEHATIVDLIRNDLSMVARQVQVARYRYIEEIETHKGRLLQTSSHVKGVLPPDYCSHIGDILMKLLPAGSITGAPKPKTVAIIDQAEAYTRAYYTGVCGVFKQGNLDSAVMIRFIEQTSTGLVFKSGGGITAFSQVEDEYKELLQKIYLPINSPN